MLALAPHAHLFSVGKRCGGPSTAQQVIDQQLVDAARHYQRIVRLKGGDPMLFSRAQEEIDALTAAGIEFEVIPGVTAASGAAAELRCPLTRRTLGRTLLLATPRVAKDAPDSEWVKAVLASDSAALYMAGDALAWVSEQLMAGGADPETPTVVIEDATLPTMRSDAQTLADLRTAPPRRAWWSTSLAHRYCRRRCSALGQSGSCFPAVASQLGALPWSATCAHRDPRRSLRSRNDSGSTGLGGRAVFAALHATGGIPLHSRSVRAHRRGGSCRRG